MDSRFHIPEGNKTAVLDRETGTAFRLHSVTDANNLLALLLTLLEQTTSKETPNA